MKRAKMIPQALVPLGLDLLLLRMRAGLELSMRAPLFFRILKEREERLLRKQIEHRSFAPVVRHNE
jgi:hypothetical protein